MAQPPTADFPVKLSYLFKPARYKVAHGGRGSGKSWGFARALLTQAANRRMRVLCARELQLSIQESVHNLLSEQIEAMELESRYRIGEKIIRGINGSEFVFAGIKSDPRKIKSMEGIDIAWVEEAEKVSADSWEKLIPTIRKPGSEIWVTFNPDDAADPTYKRFILEPPPEAVVVEVNWQDNPFFPDILRKEKDYLYRVDAEAAEHVWGGKLRKNSVAQVLRGRYSVEPFEPKPEWHGPYYGADWGFANDPTTLIRCWIEGRTLYVEYEAYEVGVDIDKTPALFDAVPDGRKHVIRADSARPETISYMRRNGYPAMIGAEKGPGSVEDGVEHLRSYERIVIHSRCKHAAEEARLWSFKVDKLTGDVQPDLVDKHNHCWDAIRYALEPIIKNRGGLLEFYKQEAERKKEPVKPGTQSEEVTLMPKPEIVKPVNPIWR
jgi:phage terminase large subunit